MNTNPTRPGGVTGHLSTGAKWAIGVFAAALLSIPVSLYFNDEIARRLPWYTAEGELPECGAPVTDVGAFTVQVESIDPGAVSEVMAIFPDEEFCALPAEKRPGSDTTATAVLVDQTHPTHATAFLAACKFADKAREHTDDLRGAGTGVRSRLAVEQHDVDWISPDGQECRGALPRSITDPAVFVRTYFDVVGNQKRTNELSAWLSDRVLAGTSPETTASYWKDDVDEVRLVDHLALPQPAPETGLAVVQIRLCIDETVELNKPLALHVSLVHDSTSWRIDRVDERPSDPNHCDA